MPAFAHGDDVIMEARSPIPARHAATATGMIRVILPDKTRADSVWSLVELPILLMNPDVPNISRAWPET